MAAQPGLGDGPGHAPDDAGLLILGDDGSAGLGDYPRSGHTLAPHAGQHRDQNLGVENPCGAPEQRIGGRAAEILRRVVVDADAHGVAVLFQDHVLVPRGHVDVAGFQDFPVLALARGAAALLFDVLGQGRGEGRRHMLGDKDRYRHRGGQTFEHSQKRRRAAGGTGDQQYFRRKLGFPAQLDGLGRGFRGFLKAPAMKSGAPTTIAWT